jgi:hypothetical protein
VAKRILENYVVLGCSFVSESSPRLNSDRELIKIKRQFSRQCHTILLLS